MESVKIERIAAAIMDPLKLGLGKSLTNRQTDSVIKSLKEAGMINRKVK